MLLQLSSAHSPKQHSPDMPSALALCFPACSVASSHSLMCANQKSSKSGMAQGRQGACGQAAFPFQHFSRAALPSFGIPARKRIDSEK